MLGKSVFFYVLILISYIVVLYLRELVGCDEISPLWLASLYFFGYIVGGNVLSESVITTEKLFLRDTVLKTFSLAALAIGFELLRIVRSAIVLLSLLVILLICKTLTWVSLDIFLFAIGFLLSTGWKYSRSKSESPLEILKGVALIVIGTLYLLRIRSSLSLLRDRTSIAALVLLGCMGYGHSFLIYDMQNQSYLIPSVMFSLGSLAGLLHSLFKKSNRMIRFDFATVSIFFIIIIIILLNEIIMHQNYKMLMMIPSIIMLYILWRRKNHLFANRRSTLGTDSKKLAPLQFSSNFKKQKLLLFLLLTISVMILELLYGIAINSLGLISDAFHMVIDSISIVVGLLAAHASSWPTNVEINSFGYSRYEVLGGFVNGILLLFISIHIIIESVERIIDPPEITAAYMFTVSVIGLVVNVIGFIFFHDFHVHSHSHRSDNHCSKRVDCNMQGVFLHIVADLLGSISVIISSIFVHFLNLSIADPICSAFSAIFIFFSAIPLLISTGKILLLSIPDSDQSLCELLQQKAYVSCLSSKISLPKIWMHSTGSKELLVCLIHAKLKDKTEYFSVKYSLHRLIEDTIRENLRVANISIILHLE